MPALTAHGPTARHAPRTWIRRLPGVAIARGILPTNGPTEALRMHERNAWSHNRCGEFGAFGPQPTGRWRAARRGESRDPGKYEESASSGAGLPLRDIPTAGQPMPSLVRIHPRQDLARPKAWMGSMPGHIDSMAGGGAPLQRPPRKINDSMEQQTPARSSASSCVSTRGPLLAPIPASWSRFVEPGRGSVCGALGRPPTTGARTSGSRSRGGGAENVAVEFCRFRTTRTEGREISKAVCRKRSRDVRTG